MKRNRALVLIADDDEHLVDVLARRCQTLGVAVERAHDGITALEQIDALEPDLVILDVNMPGGNGLDVREMMEHDELLRTIPVIVLTGRTDHDTIRRCHSLVTYYIPKGNDCWLHLEPLVRELLRLAPAHSNGPTNGGAGFRVQSENIPHADNAHGVDGRNQRGDCSVGCADELTRQVCESVDFFFADQEDVGTSDLLESDPAEKVARPLVLCIDDEPAIAETLASKLKAHGIGVVHASTGTAGYRRAFTTPVDAIVLDFEMPDGNGTYALRRLRENPVTRHVPIVVLTGHRDKMLERQCYSLGAKTFLTKPVDWVTLRQELLECINRRPQSCCP